MREALRQKRTEQEQLQRHTSPFTYRFVHLAPKETSKPSANSLGVSYMSVSKKDRNRQISKHPAKSIFIDEHRSFADLVPRLASPVSALSSYRREALSAYPLQLDYDGHSLVDLWLTNFPKMMELDLSPDIEFIYNPTRSIFFPLAMASPASFQTTVLHFAALHRARLYGLEPNNDPQVIHYRTRSLRLLHDAITTSQETTDSDLAAIMSLATAESCLGDQEAAKIHTQGVRQVISNRREHNKVANNHKLELMLNWYVINNRLSSHAAAETSRAVYASLHIAFTHFVTSLNDFRTLALLHLGDSVDLKADLKHSVPRSCARESPFPRLCSTLLRILSPPLPTSPLYNHFPFQMSRFLTLLHIHTAIYFFRNSPSLTSAYLERLSQTAIEMDLEHRPNPIFLLTWAMSADKQLHNNVRHWYAHRLAIIFKSLGLETRHQITNWLLALLELKVDENGEVVVPKLDSEGLEWEVMGIEPVG